MQKSTINFILFFSIWSALSYSQNPSFCGFDFHLKCLLENNSYKEDHDAVEKYIYHQTLEQINKGYHDTNLRASEFVLPVVIHVISPPGTPIGSLYNPNDRQILEGIEELNDLFRNRNGFFSSKGVDTKISFCLATRDQSNLPINGINRVESQIVNRVKCGSDPSTDYNDYQQIVNLGGWDCCDYINIYLVTNLFIGNSCGLGGFASFPSTTCTRSHGIVVQSSDWTTKLGIQILAHEMGHFFGLYHTFQGGCRNDNCLLDGDRVCDTPPDNALHSPCTFNSCSTDSNAPFPNPFTSDVMDDTENYMDYSSCYSHFTGGQAERMMFYLETFRKCLTESAKCLPIHELDMGIIGYEIYNKCSGKFCLKLRIKNFGLREANKFKVKLTLNNQDYEVVLLQNMAPGDLMDFDLGCFAVQATGSINYTIKIVEINDQPDENSLNSTISGTEFILDPISPSRLEVVKSSCGLNGRIIIDFQSMRVNSFSLTGLDTIIVNQTGDFKLLKTGSYELVVSFTDVDCSLIYQLTIEDDCPPCISGVINRYYEVLDIDCSKRKVKLNNTNQILVGDQVLIIQMKGAILEETSTESNGSIQDIGSAGNYEINWVESVNSNEATLLYPLSREFSIQDAVQLVFMPVFDDVVVCNLTCKSWDGKTGGILAFESMNIVELAGNIDVSGKGFRQGIVSDNYYRGCFYPEWAVSDLKYGQKGEGISIQFNNKNRGKGRNANGGGGANPVNAGGGGGGLYGGGGQGGNQWVGCQVVSDAYGRGGATLRNFIGMNRLFLGGGGGGGQQNDNLGGSGGSGGGIVIIKANEIFTSNSRIISEGINAANDSQPRQYDGKGGGGAGGMIILNIETNSGQVLPLSVSGGSGGDVFETLSNSQHGPGGGGGGGVVGLYGFGTSTINVNILGGSSGTNKLTNDTWGAVNGQSGAIIEGVKLFYSVNELTYKWQIEKNFDCDFGYEVKACFEGGVITLVGGVPPQSDSCVWIRNIDTIQLVAEIHNGCSIDTFLVLEPFEPMNINVLFLEDALCDSSGWIFIEGRGGSPPYNFYINNSESPNGSFDKLVPGEYHISIKDIFGCIKDTILEIEQKVTDPPIVELIDIIEPYCVTEYGSLHFRVDTTGIFSLRLFGDLVNKVSDGLFDSLRVGTYFLELIDERGCIYNYGPYEITATMGGVLTVVEHRFCEKDFVINILGDTLFESGVFEIVIESQENCDSLYIYKIDVIAIDSIHLPVIICEGEVYLYENDTLTLPGSYFFSYTNSYGCDSIIIIELTTLNHSKYEDEVFLCFGDSIIYEGLTISTSGVYTFVLTNILGCDSIVVLNVDISELNQTQLDTLICEEQILKFEDQHLTEEGNYSFILKSSSGCDSIIFLNVQYHDSYECDPCLIYVPNAFSPNGDGINDFFTPIAVTASPIQMIVYNRWGDIVFDSIESFSWNGTFIGSKLNPDVFVYVLSIKCSDGESKTIIGEITLIE